MKDSDKLGEAMRAAKLKDLFEQIQGLSLDQLGLANEATLKQLVVLGREAATILESISTTEPLKSPGLTRESSNVVLDLLINTPLTNPVKG